jgi:hypothetical protein
VAEHLAYRLRLTAYRFAIGCCCVPLSGVLIAASSVAAQVPAEPVPAPPRPPLFAMQGEASIFGEAYGISGREPRRPGATGRAVFQPEFQFTRFFKVALDLQLTNEGTGAGAGTSSPALSAGRQRLNQIGISPSWSWGKADLGDFTDSYTPLTFSGVRVRGGGAAVNPGLLRLAAFGGRSQSAVFGPATSASYARTIAGGRIGVGRSEGSFLDLIFVRASDDPGSLPPPDDSAFVDPRLDDPTVDPDTLAVGTLLNPFSVTPQENVVAAAAGSLALFDRRLTLRGELSGSGHTRDVRASALDNEALLDEVPGFLRGLFTPRMGSSFGAAYTAGTDVRLRTFSGSATYRRVDPGFTSLGVSSLMNDYDAWELSGTQRFGQLASLRLDAARQQDNLIGQKAFTTYRSRYGGAITLRPVPRFTTSLRVQYVGMDNDLSNDDPQWISYGNWIVTSNHTLSLGRERLVRSAGIGYTYRSSGDDNPARSASSLTAHAATVRVVLAPSNAVSITPSLGLQGSSSAAGAGWHVRETYGIAAQTRVLEGRWTSSLSLGSTEDRGIGAIQTRMTSRYDLTRSDAITFTLRESRYRNAPNPYGAAGHFQERTASLQLTHRLGNGS